MSRLLQWHSGKLGELKSGAHHHLNCAECDKFFKFICSELRIRDYLWLTFGSYRRILLENKN